MTVMTPTDYFDDCKFGEIDFGLRPVFKSHILKKERKRRCVMSLKDLSLERITCYSQLTEAAVLSVPVSLLSELLCLCVKRSRLQQLSLLVQSWPHPVLRLASREEGGYDYGEEVGRNVDQRKEMIRRKSQVVITAINRTIATGEREGEAMPSVSTLDITNLPMTFLFLSRTSSSMNRCSPLRVISDVVVDDDAGSLQDMKFSLQVRHLYFTCYNCQGMSSKKLFQLLLRLKSCQNIHLNLVEGLQISRLDLRATFSEHSSGCQASELFTFLSREFPNVSSLDLSYNAINLNGDERATSIVQTFLASLTKLTRLDIGGNRLTNKIPQILGTSSKLQYLNLTGTQLRQLDVSYLATLSGINHLDLSSNKLRNKLNVLRGMLEKLLSLQILEMIDCDLDDDCIEEIIPAFKLLENLKIVNLTKNLILRQNFHINQCQILTD